MDAMLGACAIATCILCAVAYFAGAKQQLNVCLRKRRESWMDDYTWARACDISRGRWNDQPPKQRRRIRR